MPNYRQKNRNKRNNNKNRNKNQLQQQNQQESEQQQQQQQNKNNQQDHQKQQQKQQCQQIEQHEAHRNLEKSLQQQQQQQLPGSVPIKPATQSTCDDDDSIIDSVTPPVATTTPTSSITTAGALLTINKSGGDDSIHPTPEIFKAQTADAKSHERRISVEIKTDDAVAAASTDTVSRDTGTQFECNASSAKEEPLPLAAAKIKQNDLAHIHVSATMGASNSKEQKEEPKSTSSVTQTIQTAAGGVDTEGHGMGIIRSQGKVIVHRIIQEGKDNCSEENTNVASQFLEGDTGLRENEALGTQNTQQPKEHEPLHVPQQHHPQQHQPQQHQPQQHHPQQNQSQQHHPQQYDLQQHTQCSTEMSFQNLQKIAENPQQPTKMEEDGSQRKPHEPRVIVHKIVLEEYRVESPQPTKKEKHQNQKIVKKSRSLDDEDDEYGALQIQEVSDNSSGCETDNPPLISEAESEAEQLADEEDEQSSAIESLPVDEEIGATAIKSISQQENYKQRRAQKRVAIETHFLPQFLSPRYLDSIMEENSDMSDARSEASLLSRSASDNFDDELDDHEARAKRANAVFPKSNLDFSKRHKHGQLPKAPTLPAMTIREETVPIVVEAKIIEQTPIQEICTNWTKSQTPESEAAEVIYINSASSSASDLLDLDLEEEMGGAAEKKRPTVNLDTDVMQIFSNPPKSNLDDGTAMEYENDNQRESTPVNQTLALTSTSAHAEQQQQQRQAISTTTNSEHTIKQQCQSEKKDSSEQLEKTLRKHNLAALLPIAGDDMDISEYRVGASRATAESCENSQIASNQNNFASSLGSCTFDANPNVKSIHESQSLLKLEMNDIREILNANAKQIQTHVEREEQTDSNAGAAVEGVAQITRRRVAPPPPPPVKGDYSFMGSTSSPSPPPVPPPPQSYTLTQNAVEPTTPYNKSAVLEPHTTPTPLQHGNQTPQLTTPTTASIPQLSPNDTVFVRQESADSHGSDSTTHSQCTAINVGPLTSSDWHDFDTESSVSGGNSVAPTTDESIAGDHSNLDTSDGESTICSKDNQRSDSDAAIKKLRLLCTETLAAMPYGEDVLEELANVAQNIGEVSAKMSHPLPDFSDRTADVSTHFPLKSDKLKSPSPPPVPEQPSLSNLSAWARLPMESDTRNIKIDLKPLEKLNSTEAAHCPDVHQSNFAERSNYGHDLSMEQVIAAEHKIIETAAAMKKLRKSLTPPPVPPKSNAKPPNQNIASDSFDKSKDLLSYGDDDDDSQKRLLKIILDNSSDLEHKNQVQTTTATSSFENNSRQATTIRMTNEESLRNNSEETQEWREEQEKTLIDADAPAARAFATFTQSSSSSSKKCASSAEESEHFAKFNISNNPTEENVALPSINKTISSEASTQQTTITTATTEEQQQQPDQVKMQGVGSEFPEIFPTFRGHHPEMFDPNRKRLSNIETSTRLPFCSQILSTQPKRYSTIETSSFESKKRIENGRVIYDTSDTRRESLVDGKKLFDSEMDLPVEHSQQSLFWPPHMAEETKLNSQGFSDSSHKQEHTAADSNVQDIMSALNLNSTATTATEHKLASSVPHYEKDAPPHYMSTCAHSTKIETKNIEKFEKSINRQEQHVDSTDSTLNKNITSAYEEFRQRAKAAAEATKTSTPATSTLNGESQPNNFVHDKLFKEFDELSHQLNKELESSRANKERRLKSASLFDLSRMQTESKKHYEELKKQRHEHMLELEREIERSMQSRQLKKPLTMPGNTEPNRRQSMPRTFDIPIHIENGHSYTQQQSTAAAPKEQRIFVHPIEIERDYTVTSPPEFRRAGSMFDFSQNPPTTHHTPRQRTVSTGGNSDQYQHKDDWTRYATELGSSENITRPFSREVEICCKRSRPNLIRAPRMTVSTNDLSTTNNSHSTYDTYNAYNVRRTHAPMLTQAPQKHKPQYLSCHSMIERNPQPTYISTTSRRGASPAPPTPQSAPAFSTGSHNLQEHDPRLGRRASLPREIHEQQLRHIVSKEQELKTEFERLEMERRRLLEEMQRVPILQPPPTRPMREHYRSTPKLPTLTEDEVFRQQMAKEWLSKVAEREERRLQKIIKISKIDEPDHGVQSFQQPCPKEDIGGEFLKRVRERRSKLAMPSDSDWESGAESQPVGAGHASESDELPPVKLIEGKSEKEAELRQLPKHLREFAKFSNKEREEFDNGHQEVLKEEERRHEVTDNSVSSAVKKSSVVKSFKVSKFSGDDSQTTSVPVRFPSSLNTENASFPEALNPTWTSTADPFSSFFAAMPKFPFALPATFNEMFSNSPFKRHIYDEFQNYLRKFDSV